MPKPKEIRTAKQQQKIISNHSVHAFCPICKHEVAMVKDTKAHCLPCLMKGVISELQLRPTALCRRKRTRKNSRVKTYKMI